MYALNLENARSFVFCRRSLFVFVSFFCHCVVCPSSIYGFWLPLWYIQAFLMWWCKILYWFVCFVHWREHILFCDVILC